MAMYTVYNAGFVVWAGGSSHVVHGAFIGVLSDNYSANCAQR